MQHEGLESKVQSKNRSEKGESIKPEMLLEIACMRSYAHAMKLPESDAAREWVPKGATDDDPTPAKKFRDYLTSNPNILESDLNDKKAVRKILQESGIITKEEEEDEEEEWTKTHH